MEFDFSDLEDVRTTTTTTTTTTSKPSTAAPSGSGILKIISNVDITSPIGTGLIAESKVIVHSVAEGGKWSPRGTMGAISRVFGNKPAAVYASSPLKAGEVQYIQVSNRYNSGKLWVCNLYAQKLESQATPTHIFIHDAFISGIKKVAEFAITNSCSVHIARPHVGTPGMDWNKVLEATNQHLVSKGINVALYTRDTISRGNSFSEPITPTKDTTPTKTPVDSSPTQPITNSPLKEDDVVISPTAISKPPPDDLLKGVKMAFSGYSVKITTDLKEKVEKMGGTTQTSYRSFGNQSTDYLICETLTEDYEHVNKLGGKILVKEYIEKCWSTGKRPNESKYIFNPTGEDDVEGIPATPPLKRSLSTMDSLLRKPTLPIHETKPVDTKFETPPAKKKKLQETPTEYIPKTNKIQEYGKSIELSLNDTSSFELTDLFTGIRFYIEEPEESQLPFIPSYNSVDEVKRYIVAYDGDVFDKLDDSINYMIVLNNKPFKAPHKKCKAIGVSWIWKCINEKKLHSCEDYIY